MSEHVAYAGMPSFRDPSGEVWHWDDSSKSYVRGPEHDEVPFSSATGGDNNLFDPFRHTEQEGVPELEGHMARFITVDEAREIGQRVLDGASRQVLCPNCQEETDQHACPICAKDLTPEWNADQDDLLDHPVQRTVPNDGMPDRVPKRNRMNSDDAYPSMSLSHFEWAKKLASRHVLSEDEWDDLFAGGGKAEIGKWLLDTEGHLHFDHGMHALHENIAQRDGIQYPSEVAALGSVYNDGSADTQKIFPNAPFDHDSTQQQITQAFGEAVTLAPPVGTGETKGDVFAPFQIASGQWVIAPQFASQPITGIAWVKERAQGQYAPNMILVAEHLQPEDFELWIGGTKAIITATGGLTSHAAYLASTEGIPVIVGIGDAYNKIETGNHLKIEPGQHTITVMPGDVPREQESQAWDAVYRHQLEQEASNPDLKPTPVFSHYDEELAWRAANDASLDSCPGCNDVMVDQDGEKACHSCGHKQPIITVAAQKESFLPALLLGAGGAAAGGGGLAGIGGLMAGALGRGALMGAAQNVVNGPAQSPSPNASVPTGAEMQGVVSKSDEVGLATKNRGDDVNPENNSSGSGFTEDHGDSPELLKDVGGIGGADDATPEHHGDPALQEKALKAFHLNLPLVIELSESDEAGIDNPILKALDELLEEAFPGYKDGVDPEGAEDEHPLDTGDEESDETLEDFEETLDDPEVTADLHDEDDQEKPKPDPKEASVFHTIGSDYTWDDAQRAEAVPEEPPYVICANCEHSSTYAEYEAQEAATGSGDQCPKCGEQMFDAAEFQQPYEPDQDEYTGPGDYEMYGPDQPRMEDFVSREHTAVAWADPQQQQQMQQPGGFPQNNNDLTQIANACPMCGQSHIVGTPCPTTAIQPQVQPPTTGAPIQPMPPNKVITKWQVISWGNPGDGYSEGYEDHPENFEGEFNDFEQPPTCPACGGPGNELGQLGSRMHYRCRNCGIDFSTVDGQVDPGHNMYDQYPADVPDNPGLDMPSYESHFGFYTAADDDSGSDDSPAHSEHKLDKDVQHEDSGQDNPWIDESGAPLQEGADYELKSSEYAIPDRITIDQILPHKMVYTTHSGDVDYQNELNQDDIATNGYTFAPVGFDDSQVDSIDGFQHEAPIRPGDDALPQETDLSSPSTVVSTVTDPEAVEALKGIQDELGVPGDGYPMPVVNAVEIANSALDNYTGSFSGDAPDSRAWLNEGGGGVDVDPILMAKLAGKDYSPREQREFIDETGEARNLDRLDLSGTHYLHDDIDAEFNWL